MLQIHALPENIIPIAITGGPGAGKSDFINILRRDYPSKVIVVPEVARSLMKQGLFRSPIIKKEVVPDLRDPFQVTIAHVQLSSELQLARWAAREYPNQKIFLICDRGFFDAAAYLSGGVNEMAQILNVDVAALYERYQLVIWLQSAAFVTTESDWQKQFQDNERQETREHAMGLCPLFGEVWKPVGDRLHFIEAEKSKVLDKMQKAEEVFLQFAHSIGVELSS